MKKFTFPLDTALNYKHQILDALQAEHAECLARLNEQQALLDSLYVKQSDLNSEYSRRCERGLAINDVLIFQAEIKAVEREIELETIRLEELRMIEQAKLAEVVEAKKDVSGIEKLKEKKLKEYNKAVAKSEEIFIEDFVSSERIRRKVSNE